jgi:hypothetical protein
MHFQSSNPIFLYLPLHPFRRADHWMNVTLGEFHMRLITSVMNMCLITLSMSVLDSFGKISARVVLSVVRLWTTGHLELVI